MTYWKTEHFKALQKAWYRRLEASGFRDAEEMIDDEMVLRQTAAHIYKDTDDLGRVTKEAYWRSLAQYVQEARDFRCDVDKLILTMFAEGARIKSIREELMRIGKPLARNTIRFRIRAYQIKWGVRTFTKDQTKYVPKRIQKVS